MSSRPSTAAPTLLPARSPEPRPRPGRAGLLSSFGYAFRGLVELAATERNMKLHVLAGLCVSVLGSELRLPLEAQLAIVLSVALVLAAEAVNSALEALVDLHTSEFREEARRVKDTAAGAVLVLALGTVVVAAVVVTRTWPAGVLVLGQLRTHVPEDAAISVAGATLLALGPGRLLVKVAAAGTGAVLLAFLAARTNSGPFTAMAMGLVTLAAASALYRPPRERLTP